MRRPRFNLKVSLAGKWYWSLVAANGETLCHSEEYASKQMARKGIRAARVAAATAAVREYPGRTDRSFDSSGRERAG